MVSLNHPNPKPLRRLAPTVPQIVLVKWVPCFMPVPPSSGLLKLRLKLWLFPLATSRYGLEDLLQKKFHCRAGLWTELLNDVPVESARAATWHFLYDFRANTLSEEAKQAFTTSSMITLPGTSKPMWSMGGRW